MMEAEQVHAHPPLLDDAFHIFLDGLSARSEEFLLIHLNSLDVRFRLYMKVVQKDPHWFEKLAPGGDIYKQFDLVPSEWRPMFERVWYDWIDNVWKANQPGTKNTEVHGT